jgi:cellulose synthase/poly-beta-1,6-N-acetylglucosamine synthase-like glycosyltransferase
MAFPDLTWDLCGSLEITLLLSTGLYVAGIVWFGVGVRKTFSDNSRPRSPEGQSQPVPFISIVIAARNEASNIGPCLEQLTRQCYPPQSYEIIVVDDGSQDPTASQVAPFVGTRGTGAAVKLMSTTGLPGGGSPRDGSLEGGKKAALSLGIESAQGDIIATTDADCSVSETWLREVADCFEPRVGMVVGFSQIEVPGRIRGLRQGWEGVDFFFLMLAALGSVRLRRPMAASGQNLSFRREAFEEVGGYSAIRHRASGDDVLLLQLIRRTGHWKIAFATSEGSFAVHPASPGWKQLLSKRTRWASNAPYQMRMDPLFFAYLCATFAMSLLLVGTTALAIAAGTSALWPLGCWIAKLVSEWWLMRAGIAVFGRRDLCSYFPLWTVTQPLYVVAVGVLGCLGRFEWKGQRHWWGRQLLSKIE